MTKIKFFKNGNIYTGYECSGHTGYAEFGKDILCASISSLAQSCLLGLNKVLKINTITKRNDKNGYIKVELPKSINSEKLSQAQVLLNTLKLSLEDLQLEYSKYISMEVIENVY